MHISRHIAALAAAFCCALTVFAQEDATPAADAPAAGSAALVAYRPAKEFYTGTLCCKQTEGTVEVRTPGGEWKDVQAGRHYPLGSEFRCITRNNNPRVSNAQFALGTEPTVSISNNTEFATLPAAIDDPKRTVVLKYGMLAANCPPFSTNGTFTVALQGVACRNITGETFFECTPQADGEKTTITVSSGAAVVEGLHFRIPAMKTSNKLTVRTLENGLYTALHGESGIYKIVLSQGIERRMNAATAKFEDVNKTLTFEISPRSIVKIFRKRIPENERFVVCTMTIDAGGKIKNRAVFADGRYNINTGELESQKNDAKSLAEAEQAEQAAAVPLPAAQPAANQPAAQPDQPAEPAAQPAEPAAKPAQPAVPAAPPPGDALDI